MTDSELLELVEGGAGGHPLQRAVLLASYALPTMPPDEVPDLPVGARNIAIWSAADRWFGGLPAALGVCPTCGSEQEFSLPPAPAAAPGPGTITVDVPGARLRVRPLTSRDLASPGIGRREPREALARRAVVEVLGGELPEVLPSNVLDALGDALEAADPAASVPLDLACAECGQHWETSLDVPRFVWAALAGRWERLMDDIATLAGAYRWSEADILAIPPRRRQRYLDRLVT